MERGTKIGLGVGMVSVVVIALVGALAVGGHLVVQQVLLRTDALARAEEHARVSEVLSREIGPYQELVRSWDSPGGFIGYPGGADLAFRAQGNRSIAALRYRLIQVDGDWVIIGAAARVEDRDLCLLTDEESEVARGAREKLRARR